MSNTKKALYGIGGVWLAGVIILVRQGDGKDAALATLGVVVFAFTMQLVVSFIERPRRQP